MCGIAGVYSFKGKYNLKSINNQKILKSINHRGPDDSGSILINNTILFNTRLAIQDLTSNAKMPLKSLNANIWISFNGEIYNSPNLREELIKKGYKFKSSSDTEVVVNSFLEWGIRSFSKLNGIFAFSILDVEREELYIVRDKVGIKPLIYYHDNEKLIFSSELDTIIKTDLKNVNLSKDLQSINQYFIFGNIPSPYSPFLKIKKLNPGNYIQIKKNKFTINKYSEFNFSYNNKNNNKNAVDDLDKILSKSVEDQMLSDAPLGVFLSGGVDSSIISYYASKAKNNIQSFSLGYDDKKFNESNHAKEVAKYLHTNHNEIILSNKDYSNEIDETMGNFDEPFYDSSSIPTNILSKYAKEKVKVVLSGDGADELFFGYRHQKDYIRIYENFHKSSKVKFNKIKIFNPIYENLYKGIVKYKLVSKNNIILNFLEKKIYYDRYDGFNNYLLEEKSRLKKKFRHQIYNYKSNLLFNEDQFSNLFKDYCESDISEYDFKNYLPNDILVKVDRMSMSNGLEVRVPFLADEVINFASNLSLASLRDNNHQKLLLRQIIKKKFVDTKIQNIILRPKHGFQFPMSNQLNKYLKNKIMDSLKNKKFLNYFQIPENIINKMLNNYKKNNSNIWVVYCLYLWWIKKIEA